MTSAITLAGWLLIFGGWFALACILAVPLGKFLRGPKRELVPPSTNGYWLEEPDWRFPARPRVYDQEQHGPTA